ncbi:hypothetical protein A5893_06125 [Pedobacter psychrophilus]|uniref:Uncharacterized protein n=1 Tax=Pedobacter psychrophilus TaxID=1826909 RepID=A0A179DIA1_9SPHI|nr:hypothetical protein [Pedobacter psychrophilus]OAQ40522.1 hypothetical protein A5893_06125 [Pedobacter psychrophilus]
MEFDEMRKIWDTQNNESIYVINEQGLYNRILNKKKQAFHITNVSEMMSILVNLASGSFIIAYNIQKSGDNLFLYLLGVWMLLCSLYITIYRVRRLKGNKKFDRTLRGDLAFSISVTAYQVRLSQFMRWNIFPLSLLMLLSMWDGAKSLWLVSGTIIFLSIVYYLSGLEHNFYKKLNEELEILRDKLENEDVL